MTQFSWRDTEVGFDAMKVLMDFLEFCQLIRFLSCEVIDGIEMLLKILNTLRLDNVK